MTRQQEGDEAAVKAKKWIMCREKFLAEGCEIGVCQLQKGHKGSHDNTVIELEDETTLPALDAKCACGGSIEAIRSVHSYDECVNMDCYAPRIQMEAVLQALEAERDALKAENEELKAADSMKNTFWGQYKVQRERADSLQSQLDAVVGQETPQDAWERGFEEGIGAAIAQVQTSVNLHPQTKLEMFLLESPPYTPPLKAGTETEQP